MSEEKPLEVKVEEGEVGDDGKKVAQGPPPPKKRQKLVEGNNSSASQEYQVWDQGEHAVNPITGSPMLHSFIESYEEKPQHNEGPGQTNNVWGYSYSENIHPEYDATQAEFYQDTVCLGLNCEPNQSWR